MLSAQINMLSLWSKGTCREQARAAERHGGTCVCACTRQRLEGTRLPDRLLVLGVWKKEARDLTEVLFWGILGVARIHDL